MAANPALQLNSTRERGWLDGFANLFRNENAAWWRTRRWIIHVVLWTVLVNGMLASVLWAPQPQTPAQAQEQAGPDTTNPLVLGTLLFVVVGGLATGTGAIILMQGTILDEKKSGTAEWILSKPVSRSAFIWSKLCANGLAALLIMIVLQGVIAYLLVSARLGNAPPLIPFASGIATAWLEPALLHLPDANAGHAVRRARPGAGYPAGSPVRSANANGTRALAQPDHALDDHYPGGSELPGAGDGGYARPAASDDDADLCDGDLDRDLRRRGVVAFCARGILSV